MLNHLGFSAWVAVDGVPIPEYLVAVNSSTNQVSCWIPSSPGRTFSVHWKDHGGNVDTIGFVILDGNVVPGRFLYGHGEAIRNGMRTSTNSHRPFMFQIVPEESGFSSSSNKDAGTIMVKIKRVKRVAPRPANSFRSPPDSAMGRRPGEAYIGYGPSSPTTQQSETTWDVEPYDDDGSGSNRVRTHVSFVFRYRTLEFLRAQGIVDHAPTSPIRTTVPRRIVSAPVPIDPARAGQGMMLLDTTPGQVVSAETSKHSRYMVLSAASLSQTAEPARRTVSARQADYPGESVINFDNPFPNSQYTYPPPSYNQGHQ